MKSKFVSGLDLSEGFYRDAVQPILQKEYPQMHYSAALIGDGSEVLGFDSEMSSDHCWGPRCQIFLTRTDCDAYKVQMWRKFSLDLPTTYLGFPTSFTEPNLVDKGTQSLDPQHIGPVNHGIDILPIDQFFENFLGVHINQEIAISAWLVQSSQKLRSIVSGRVFHDDLGLQQIRNRLEWYPRDIWLYILASCWNRIGQEEHLMGRAGLSGDEIGSSLIGSRLVRDIMRLAFYMERKYPPYPKWFGTAFKELQCSAHLMPFLMGAIHSVNWEQRENNLYPAMELMVIHHNSLGITSTLPSRISSFWGRPFKVIWGEKIGKVIAEQIGDPHIQRLATLRPIGSVDLFSDNTDMVGKITLNPILEKLFD
jgi:hypothetical protein